MMAPIKIIPCLDMKEGRVVKGVHFVALQDAGDPVAAARAYCEDGADELAFLDITATVENRRSMFDVLERVAAVVTVPLTMGGGLRSSADIRSALDAGATRVSLSSAAYRDPDMVARAIETFGADSVIVAIDADVNPHMPSGREVYIDGGRTATGKDAVVFAKEMAALGVGALLPTSKATDGVQQGYDLVLTRGIADATGLPVIASGGAGTLEHFAAGVSEGHASALLAASVFHFGTFTVRQVKEYLRGQGIAVNL
jgi:cyclase